MPTIYSFNILQFSCIFSSFLLLRVKVCQMMLISLPFLFIFFSSQKFSLSAPRSKKRENFINPSIPLFLPFLTSSHFGFHTFILREENVVLLGRCSYPWLTDARFCPEFIYLLVLIKTKRAQL